VPDDRVPVGVQHEQPAARVQHAPRLGQRSLDVVDVLIDLSRDRDVELLVSERQCQRVTAAVIDRRLAMAGDREHAVAQVDPIHAPVDADLLGHLGGQEARPGADVEHLLAGLERDRSADRAPLVYHVGRRVHGDEAARSLLVEVEHDSDALTSAVVRVRQPARLTSV